MNRTEFWIFTIPIVLFIGIGIFILFKSTTDAQPNDLATPLGYSYVRNEGLSEPVLVKEGEPSLSTLNVIRV